MKTITLLNEKGGVGKTTLSTHLAAGLAILGANVLVIDADAQGHASTSLGLDKDGGLYDLLVRETKSSWKSVAVPSPRSVWAGKHDTVGNLYVVQSNKETRSIAENVSNAMVLRRRLQEVQNSFDYVVIDTSPTPSLLHTVILLASDYIIYPTELENLSLDGLRDSLAALVGLEQINPRYANLFLGIQPNKFDARLQTHQHGLSILKAQHGTDVWEPINDYTEWTKASYYRQSLFAYAPDGIATAQAWRFVERVKQAMSVRA